MDALKLAIALSFPLLIGLASGYLSSDSISTWYQTLEKPSFNPPNWLFGPVWTLLYLLMGVSLYLAWTKTSLDKLPFVFIQLFLNAAWSPLFFLLQNPLLALVDIALLWLAIIAMIFQLYAHSRSAALLQVPYFLWVTFAAALNLAIALLN